MRRPRPLLLSSLLVAGVMPAVAAPGRARAQTTAGDVELGQYRPTPFSDRTLRLDGTAVLPLGQYRVGADLDYAYRPLHLDDSAPLIVAGNPTLGYDLVKHAAGGALLASFGLGHRLEAGVMVPLTLLQLGQSAPGTADPGLAGVGNIRLGLKARLVGWRGLGVGAAVLVAVPGGIGALTHESGFGGEARLLADFRRGRLGVGLRAGLRLRAATVLYDIPLGNELTFAAGAAAKLAMRTTVFAELAGATAAGDPFARDAQSPVELLGGLRQRLGKTWLTAAAGPGLLRGYGSPAFRAVLALTWANKPPDSDGDGVSDDDDRCPEEPEDRDGFEDADGCPDPDNDRDGIPDAQDRCPLEPEDKDGFEDADGCPDPDNDRDGIPDVKDKCPDKPETVNGFQDDDGCPDDKPPPGDRDKDGILDDKDECPDEPEDKDGFEDDDGCPDPDNDKDGILDAKDKCPLEPETINGIDDDDGCPDKGRIQVKLGAHEIETLKPIFFDTDRSRVRHAFYSLLGQVALVLNAHPEIGRCAIEGHTDDTGPPEWNRKLSVLRAEAVIEFLADKGVDRKRLVAIGHGESLPWASNETEEGRAQNRRVVFHIEGVDAEAQKKAEQRQERRWRIHREREKEKQREKERELRQKDEREPEPPQEKARDKPREKAPEKEPPEDEKPAGEKPEKDRPAKEKTEKPKEKVEARPAEKPKRSPADGGPPPTLRDLLKLPPR